MMGEWSRQEPEETIIFGRDFHARTGGETVKNGPLEQKTGRMSNDKKKDECGDTMIEELAALGWEIFHGSTAGDETGEFTYTCKLGNSGW